MGKERVTEFPQVFTEVLSQAKILLPHDTINLKKPEES